MITAKLTIAEQEYTVTWDAGELSGDLPAVYYLEALAALLHTKPIRAPGLPTSTGDHVKSAPGMIALCQRASETIPVFDISGDEPDLEPPPQPPEGAIE